MPGGVPRSHSREAYEDVATKAGTFKAFRVRRDFSEQETGRGRTETWSQTLWFAPEARTTVKFTTTRPRVPEWELTSYTIK